MFATEVVSPKGGTGLVPQQVSWVSAAGLVKVFWFEPCSSFHNYIYSCLQRHLRKVVSVPDEADEKEGRAWDPRVRYRKGYRFILMKCAYTMKCACIM
jgi:hypothetical protein